MGKKLVKNIFVVDDNELLSTMLEDYITSKTMYKVRVFSTGEECINHLHEEPDVIILDYNLNSVDTTAADGGKILDAIKRIDSSIHVIMLSSQDSYGTALKTINKGADTYIVKDDNAFEKLVSFIQGM